MDVRTFFLWAADHPEAAFFAFNGACFVVWNGIGLINHVFLSWPDARTAELEAKYPRRMALAKMWKAYTADGSKFARGFKAFRDATNSVLVEYLPDGTKKLILNVTERDKI